MSNDKMRALHAALLSVNAVAIDRGDKYGACDQIDNDGVPYQSQWLADLLAETPAAQAQEAQEQGPCGNRDYCGRHPFCGCGSEAPFPERDPSKPAEQQGLFRKFDVRRVDGSDAPGGKHHGCRYYVLDLAHDEYAPAAMRAYAAACKATYPQLAADIEAEFGAQEAPSEPVSSTAGIVQAAKRVVRWMDTAGAIKGVQEARNDMNALRAALASAQAAVPDAMAGDHSPRRLIEQCRDALATELSAWDISPPLAHINAAHEACVAWLAAAPSTQQGGEE